MERKKNLGDLWDLDGYSNDIEKNKLIELDFSDDTQSFIINSSDKYQLKDLEIPYIPKKIHPILCDTFLNSKVFVWRSKWDNKNKKYYKYLIPCAELFTSTYTPNLKDFRNRLLSRELNDALIKYIDFSRTENLDNEYRVKFLKGHYDVHTISCLTYLALNEDSRRRATEIFHSMQESHKGKSYLSTKPYHPKSLQLLVEGKVINNSAFLVTKIKASSVPTENKISIIPNAKKKKSPSSEDGGLEPGIKQQTNTHSANVEIISDQDPTNNSPEVYIKSPIVLVGDKPEISVGNTTIMTNSGGGDIIIDINEENEVSLIMASEGEPHGSSQSSIAQVRNIQPNNQVDQQTIFEDISKSD